MAEIGWCDRTDDVRLFVPGCMTPPLLQILLFRHYWSVWSEIDSVSIRDPLTKLLRESKRQFVKKQSGVIRIKLVEEAATLLSTALELWTVRTRMTV